MGYKRDQNYHAETSRRRESESDKASELPPYTEEAESRASPNLPPPQGSEVASTSKRKLLLLYIHGFTGNETSFQAFPTHVHDLISNRLAKSYTVQSIIYPKYKSRKRIEFARDELSAWQEAQHESTHTDVVLLGHSMGGLLAAEVALLPVHVSSALPLRHRILGTVNLDVPFLGVHPGIIPSGITNLFRKAPGPPDELTTPSQEQLMDPSSSVDLPEPPPLSLRTGDAPAASVSSLSSDTLPAMSTLSPESNDTTSGPPTPAGPRQSTMSRAIYFINKHGDGLTKATKSYLTSHIEFGSCLADYKGLINRYSRIRALEDDPRSRVRFVNFYTASTGRPKKQKPPRSTAQGAKPLTRTSSSASADQELQVSTSPASDHELQHRSPRASIDEEKDKAFDPDGVSSQENPDVEPSRASEDRLLEISNQSCVDPTCPPNREAPAIPTSTITIVSDSRTLESQNMPSVDGLAPIPDPPSKPLSLNPSQYTDKDMLKIASRDQDRAMKAYNRLIKDRDNAIKDRRKLLAKKAKAAAKEQKMVKGKGNMDEKVKTMNAEEKDNSSSDLTRTDCFEPLPLTPVSSPSSPPPFEVDRATAVPAGSPKSAKKAKQPKQPKAHKYRPFCLLPDQSDPTWVSVVMRDVGETDAHCGLFVREGEHYEGFVADVVDRISSWVETSGR